ncbi:MAG: hypothetical protein ABI039_08690 [Vicinamibacterales bacterium]
MTLTIVNAALVLTTVVALGQTLPTAPEACALVTPAEAVAIIGAPARAPRVGAFAPNTCLIQSDATPADSYINITLDTVATLKAQGMSDAKQAYDGLKRGTDDAEAVAGAGDSAFFSKTNNGLYVLKGTKFTSVLISPALMQREPSVAALKKLAAAIAARM